MYPELTGKVAIITGAGRRGGLGAAMAQRLAAEGAQVVITDLAVTDEMHAVLADIHAAGGRATGLACDMLDADQVQAMVSHTQSQFGGVDILVNNAGVGFLMKPIMEMSVAEWDTVLGVNLRGVFLATQAVARVFAAQQAAHLATDGDAYRGGRIVNIASVNGLQATDMRLLKNAAYVATKHAVVGLTRQLATEWGTHGITVNAICPNHVTTGLGAWQNEYFAKLLGKSVEQYLAEMKARIPLGRPGLVDDTANACAFLCSDQAQYITGEAMNVSGGEEYH